MVYIGFDFDLTLGDFGSIFEIFPTQNSPYYKDFVNIFAEKEMSSKPFKIINPRIVKLLPTLKYLKDIGYIQAIVIYSNNSSYELIRFIADVMGVIAEDPNLVDGIAHLTYPGRDGSGTKTLSFLKDMFSKATGTGIKEIHDKDIYFIDDQYHEDIYNKIYKDKKDKHYILIKPYVSQATKQNVYSYLAMKFSYKNRIPSYPILTRKRTLKKDSMTIEKALADLGDYLGTTLELKTLTDKKTTMKRRTMKKKVN